MRLNLETIRIARQTATRRDTAQSQRAAAHARAVRRRNDEARRFPHARFHVIELATGAIIGRPGDPHPIAYAQSVRHYHDYAGLGTHALRAANHEGECLLAWRAAA